MNDSCDTKDFHAILMNNGVVEISVREVEAIDPDPENDVQPKYFLGMSSVFLFGPGADLEAEEGDDDGYDRMVTFGKDLALTALDLIRELDFGAHPDIEGIDMHERCDLHPSFSRKAGCNMCACSPGFPLYSRVWVNLRDGRRVYVNVYVTVGWDNANDVPAAPPGPVLGAGDDRPTRLR